jgi:hypothetical protein
MPYSDFDNEEDPENKGWGPPATAGIWGPPSGPPLKPGSSNAGNQAKSRSNGRGLRPWQSKLSKGIDIVTNAQMRQAAFRAPHGAVQALRYAAGLEPMGRRTQGMFRAETFQNLALSPRQFPASEVEEPEV